LRVVAVDLEANAPAPEPLGGHERRPGPEKRIEDHCAFETVQLDATLRQGSRKARRMVMLLRLGLHRLVGDEPDVASTAPILGVAATRDIRLVGKRHSDGKPISTVTDPDLVKWKMASWLGFRKRLLLMGLKWP
jgi:hypothetical protein